MHNSQQKASYFFAIIICNTRRYETEIFWSIILNKHHHIATIKEYWFKEYVCFVDDLNGLSGFIKNSEGILNYFVKRVQKIGYQEFYKLHVFHLKRQYSSKVHDFW